MKKTVALCMIVKNEEQHLDRCLKSVSHLVDQIVIVDTGSEDKTVEIAQSYNSEVYSFEWVNDFSIARNESLKYANTDYILVLDADEYLEESADLQSIIASNHDYYFSHIHNLLSGDRAIKHRAIRLFANYRGLQYRNRLHEHLNTMDEDQNYTAEQSNLKIMHTGYTDDMLEDRDKANRNLKLMLKEVHEFPTAYNLFNMGRTYMWIKEYDKAIDFLKRAYPLSKGLIILPELIATLCRCLVQKQNYTEALSILQDAVKVYPNEVDLLHLQAMTLKDADYRNDAITIMKECIQLGDEGITLSEGAGGYVAYYRLAEWYEEENQMELAYENIVKAMEMKPDFIVGTHKYLQILNKVNVPIQDQYKSLNSLYSLNNIEKLTKFLEVLYSLRSPMLKMCLDEYNVNTELKIQAVAQQYSKNYEQAAMIWMQLDENDIDNGKDILLLAIILGNKELMSKSLELMNFSKKEKKLLDTIINENSKEEKLTSNLEKALEFVLVQLMQLQEFDLFSVILEKLKYSSIDFKTKIYAHLIAYGFTELAIDLLVNEFQDYPRNKKVISLLGLACKSAGYLDDAMLFYSKLSEIEPKCKVYEDIYELYLKKQDVENANLIKNYIRNQYPFTLWTK